MRKSLLTCILLSLCGISLATIHYVKPNASDTGTDWSTATSLTNAIAQASPGDTLFVSKGTYFPVDTETPFTIDKTIKVYGGFSGTDMSETIRTRSNFSYGEPNASNLDGDLGNIGSNLDNAYRVLHIESTDSSQTIVDGFIIKNGTYTEVDQVEKMYGNGVFITGATLSNCVIHSNLSSGSTLNEPYILGTGIHMSGSAFIRYCKVVNNQSLGNSNGAGVGMAGNYNIIENCLIANNSSARSGGGIAVGHGTLQNAIIASTIANNQAIENGGGVYLYTGNEKGVAYLQNSLIYNNSAQTAGEFSLGGNKAEALIFNCATGDNIPISGNAMNNTHITVNPFIQPTPNIGVENMMIIIGANWGLKLDNELIDLGATYNPGSNLARDLAGNPRLMGNMPDIGAYEDQSVLGAGKSLELNGSTYLSADAVSENNFSAYTLETWCKIAPSGNQMTVFGFHTSSGINRSVLFFKNETFVFSEAFNNQDWDYEPQTTFEPVDWNHIAISCDSEGNAKLYLNGVLDKEFTLNTRPQPTDRFSIGQDWDGNNTSDFLHGEIDETRIWNVVRTPEEIFETLHMPLTGDEHGLVAYYQYNETNTENLVEKDMSGNGYQATFAGANPARIPFESQALMSPFIRDITVDADFLITVTWDEILNTPSDNLTVFEEDIEIGSKPHSGNTHTFQGEPNSDYRLMVTSNIGDGGKQGVANETFKTQGLTPPGNAFVFDGATYIEANSIVNKTFNSFTYETWVKLDNLDMDVALFGSHLINSNYDNHQVVFVNTEGRVGINEDDGQQNIYNSQKQLKPNQWYHLAITCSSTNVAKIYINGVLDGEFSTAKRLNSDCSFSIGQEWDETIASNFLQGQLDELRIWNIERTQEQILSDMHSELNENQTGLVAYYNFDQLNSKILPDLSTEPFNGTVVGNHTGAWVTSQALLTPFIREKTVTTNGAEINWDEIPFANEYSLTITSSENQAETFILEQENFIQIENLTPGTKYILELTATTPEGIVSQTIKDSIITQPEVVLHISSIICPGEEVTLDAGNPDALSYIWSTGAKTKTITLTTEASKEYYVTVTMPNASMADGLVVETYAEPLTLTSESTNIACFGEATGDISISATGATGQYTYTWSNGAETMSITDLSAGTYSVTVTSDACIDSLKLISITEPTSMLSVETNEIITPSCFGDENGSLSFIASGGTEPYTYIWETGQTTNDASNLSAGDYTITVTDANNCTVSGQQTLTEPTSMLTVESSEIITPSCFGDENGSLSFVASGGTEPYTYIWETGQTTNEASNLSAGDYTITVTDANNCTVSGQQTLTEPTSMLTIETNEITQPTCFGDENGSLSFIASGGVEPYTYIWETGQTTNGATNLSAGDYTITVTDANNCTVSGLETLTEPTSMLTVESSEIITPSCFGDENGSVSFVAIGGIEPYTYIWETGQTTNEASNLSAGDYTITVTDANNCTVSGQQTLTEPFEITVNAGADTRFCRGEVAKLSGTVTGSATYTWTGGEGTYTESKALNVQYTPVETEKLVKLTLIAGEGECKVSDELTVTIDELPEVSITLQNEICYNASPFLVDVSPAPNTASTYTLMGTDADDSQTFTPATASDTTQIVYSYTDENGCTNFAEAQIARISVLEPEVISDNPKVVVISNGELSDNTNLEAQPTGGGSINWLEADGSFVHPTTDGILETGLTTESELKSYNYAVRETILTDDGLRCYSDSIIVRLDITKCTNPMPEAQDISICQDASSDNIFFEASTAITNPTWQWYDESGIAIEGATNKTFAPETSTSIPQKSKYSVSYSAVEEATNQSCQSPATDVYIEVIAKPDFIINETSPVAICTTGGEYILDVELTPEYKVLGYETESGYILANENHTTGKSIFPEELTIDEESIWELNVTDINHGCSNTAVLSVHPFITDSPKITENPIERFESTDPIIINTEAGDDTVIVFYSDIELQDSIGSGISWQTPINPEEPNTAIYQAVQFVDGCQSYPVEVAISVTKVPCSVVVPQVSQSAEKVCMGDDIEFSVSNQLNGTAQWYADEELSEPIDTGNTFTYQSIRAETKTLYVTDKADECESDPFTVQYEVLNKPLVSLNQSYETPTGELLTIIPTVYYLSPSYTFNWTPVDSIYGNTGGAYIITKPLSANTTYNLTVIDTLTKCSTEHSTEVAVRNNYIPVQSINLPNSIGIPLGANLQLSYSVSPQNATNKTLNWIISDTTIATISENGTIIPKTTGITNIVVASASGSATATSLLTVTEQTIAMSEIIIPDTITAVLSNGTFQFEAFVKPYNTTDRTLNWDILSEDIASVERSTGIAKLLAPGKTQVTVYNTDSTLSETAVFKIEASYTPELVANFPALNIGNGKDVKSLDINNYIIDDNTLASELKASTASLNITTEILNGELIISGLTSLSNDTVVHISITDGDENSIEVPLTISVTSNQEDSAPVSVQAPEQLSQKDGYFNSLDLNKLISDDFTLVEDMIFSAQGTEVLEVSIENNKLTVTKTDIEWSGSDTVIVTAIDEADNSVNFEVIYTVTAKENEAPVIGYISDQTRDSVNDFHIINLVNCVTDDYTASTDIRWHAEASTKLSIDIDQAGRAFISIQDKSWMGTEIINFTAFDTDGLSSSYSVAFTQAREPQVEIDVFIVDFHADRATEGPHAPINFSADIKGAKYWQWMIGDSVIANPSLNPSWSFEEIGQYDISLTVSDGEKTETFTKDRYINIVGIDQIDTVICKGDTIKLSTSQFGFSSYVWNGEGEGTEIAVNPESTTEYILTITDVFFTYLDTVTITVAQPINLGIDTAICHSTSYGLSPTGFASYKWHNGSTENEFTVDTIGAYSLTVEDQYGCISQDTLNMTRINALPSVSLGEDLHICGGDTVTLFAGTFETFTWNTGESSQSIKVTETDTYVVQVADSNACINTDTIEVFFQYPYAEQISLATYSENSKAIVVAWERTPDKYTKEYKLLRESGSAGSYTDLVTRSYGDSLYYIDTEVNSSQQTYRYKLQTIDETCEQTAESDPHRTIHLSKNLGLDAVNLDFTAYVGLEVPAYKVMRIRDGHSEEIGEIYPDGANSYSFSDEQYQTGDKYRIAFDLDHTVVLSSLKSDSGPFSQSMSNLSEAIIESSLTKSTDKISVYPNPTDDILIIDTPTANAEIEIHSIQGELIAKYSTESPNMKIDISDYISGVYTLTIKTSNDNYQELIIKK